MRAIGATLSLTAIMVLAACDAGGGGGTTTTMSNADLLKAAAKNMREVNAYTLDADLETGGQPVKMKADVEGLNSGTKNAKMDMDAMGQKVGIIALGDKVFVSTDGGQTYTDAGASGAQMTGSIDSLANMWDQLTDAEIDKAKDQLKDGSPATETIDGVNTKHMTGNLKDLSALGSGTGGQEGTVDIWISTDSPSYVRQMRIDAKSGDTATKGTMKWLNFNNDFDIQAPPGQ
jgi:hypothetical protein